MTAERLVELGPDSEVSSNVDSIFAELQSTETQQQVEVPQIPEKFRNKSLEDVVKSYSELETQFGKQGQELGELRKLTDEIIKKQLLSGTSEDNSQRQQVREIDLINEPERSVDALLQKKLSPIMDEVQEFRKEKMTNKLKEKHPDFVEIIKDTSFQAWVKESPLRLEMYGKADKNLDIEAANELFTFWKALKGTSTTPVDTSGRDAAFSQAAMETGTVSDSTPKKIYRRADIMHLMQTNRNRYNQLEPEIRKAYMEGRVR